MITKVYSAALLGLSASPIEVEVDISSGLPAVIVVGLPDTAVQEARERVKSAIKNSNAVFPRNRVAINLAPADLPKNGSHYDLPIAISILLNSGQVFFDPKHKLFLGELALDGSIRPVSGVLPILLMARDSGFTQVFVPKGNSREASLVSGIEVIPVTSLLQLVGFLQNLIKIKPLKLADWDEILKSIDSGFDMKLIKGQEAAKRALEIAGAGGHNVLLSGPPGTGKTLLAKALPSILPKLTVEEVLEITKIYSVSGILNLENLITTRPFRSPHHTSSSAALVGGGSHPKPGEISLSHRGVLFLDEFPEFSRSVLENLRQPLEDGIVTVARAAATITFPAQFTLIAAQNPCPCGYYSDKTKKCICSPSQIMKYQKKISGPLLDRIDLFVEVGRVEYEKLSSESSGESSADIQKRVQNARDIQTKRFEKQESIKSNSEMTIKEIREFCKLDQAEQDFMKTAVIKMYLSARSYHRILKLARTIADLANTENISTTHLAEALQYRPKTE